MVLNNKILSFSVALIISTNTALAVENFSKAKTHLRKIYKSNPNQEEFYCGCGYKFQNKKGIIDFNKCEYQVRKNENRANRVEWEHVMPAENFGRHLQCWRDGGRKQCKKDTFYNELEGDLHNLQLAIGEVNGDRSNYNYAQRTNEPFLYGGCKSTVDFKSRRFYPRDEIKGVIARTYLYMNEKYNINLSRQNEQLMNAWNKTYPPAEWECKRNKLIKDIQGNENKFIQCE